QTGTGGGGATFTTPSGRTITLPPGVTAEQVRAAFQKRMSGQTLTPAEQAMLQQMRSQFQRAGGGEGGGGNGGGGGRGGRGPPGPATATVGVHSRDHGEKGPAVTRSLRVTTAAVIAGVAACHKVETAPPYSLVPVARRDIVVTATASGAIQPILTLSVKS